MSSSSSPARPLLLLLPIALLLGGCGERDHLRDFLPPEQGRETYDDPLMGGKVDARSPTDVDHAVARAKLEALAEQITGWHKQHGAWPEALDVLTPAGDMAQGEAIIPDGAWRTPVDPWGRAYEYERLAEGGFAVRSWGPDGRRDTVDDLVQSRPGPSDDG